MGRGERNAVQIIMFLEYPMCDYIFVQNYCFVVNIKVVGNSKYSFVNPEGKRDVNNFENV